MYEQLYLVWDGADLRLGKHGRVLATVVPVVGWANMWVWLPSGWLSRSRRPRRSPCRPKCCKFASRPNKDV
jgi:hypothetical protein